MSDTADNPIVDPIAPRVDTRDTTPNDLASQTGNPGHRGVNPNEAASINPRLPPEDQSLPSINEPPGIARAERVEPAAGELPTEATSGPPSINEPPGSQTAPLPEMPSEPEMEPLLSDADLSAMTRVELDEYAASRGIDSTGEATKADVIALLKA